MGIFIKNPEVERKARELADLRRVSITAALGEALDEAIKTERAKPHKKRTLEEMQAATDEFRRKAGLDKVKLGVTRADFDAMWESREGLDLD
ncbi:MAG: type II toxin-antitoxin system VapB family antitoxin [Caulobacteraceae bacterium]